MGSVHSVVANANGVFVTVSSMKPLAFQDTARRAGSIASTPNAPNLTGESFLQLDWCGGCSCGGDHDEEGDDISFQHLCNGIEGREEGEEEGEVLASVSVGFGCASIGDSARCLLLR